MSRDQGLRCTTRQAIAAGSLVLALLLLPGSGLADPSLDQSRLAEVAREARQVIAVIDWFYVQHRACPQPSRSDEIAAMEADLGDGYSAIPRGQFVEIRGISMREGWLYYASLDHRDKCTLWRKLGWDPALIWRREGGSARWTYDPGDGRPERPINIAPSGE